jgi:hypothetical protein
MKAIITILLVIISLASFGQIETKYRLDISDGDSTLQKYTYENHVKRTSDLVVFYQKEVFDLDTILLKSKKIRVGLSLNDSIQSQPIEDILNLLYNVQDSTRLKRIMIQAIRKERRGK